MDACEFSLGSSRFLCGLLLVIYGVAGIFLFLLDPLPYVLKFAGLALILYFLKQKILLHVQRSSKNAILVVWQDTKGRWGCQTRRGQSYRGVVLRDSFRSPFLVIVRLETLHQVFTILIPFDAIEPGEYRVLCRRLLFY